MDQGQHEADQDAGESAMAEDRVVPAITRMNNAVKTISAMMTAPSAKPLGEWLP